jgi:hypothetical protein
MYYTGIDLHRKTSFLTTIDEAGKIVQRRNIGNVEPKLCSQGRDSLQTAHRKFSGITCASYTVSTLMVYHLFDVFYPAQIYGMMCLCFLILK